MITKIFDEIVKEARSGVINLIQYDEYEGDVTVPVRMAFNVVKGSVSESLPNFYINDSVTFSGLLKEYAYTACSFYKLEFNYNNIKSVLTYLWSNITEQEMPYLEQYIAKAINFYNDTSLLDKIVSKTTSIGMLTGYTDNNSIYQETPYCFKSYFKEDSKVYYLPRISYGISKDVCYIYAIQNKDNSNNKDESYNAIVKDKINCINSGVKKYRNVTPSFVLSLTLFLSYLKENNINKVCVMPKLPIREQNKKLVNLHKIKVATMKGTINDSNMEEFAKKLEQKRINDQYNATVKFANCFNRLKLHFDNLFMEECKMDNKLLIEITQLITTNVFLQEIVAENNISMLKY